jgi:cytochrome oxidase Cu insertion factor (SCO1/SenC/PrrC family)
MTEVVLVNLGVLWVVVLGNLVLTAALIQRVRNSPAPAETAEVSNWGPFGPEAGSLAPDFAATTSDGQKVRLSDYRGKPLMLLMVSLQWTPCQQAVPAMLKLADVMKKKVSMSLALKGRLACALHYRRHYRLHCRQEAFRLCRLRPEP